jgi:hypothetical protein
VQVIAELLDDADGKMRLAAAEALLSRGYGRPKQSFEADPETAGLALHLLAAYAVSQEIIGRLEQQPRTIDGRPAPSNAGPSNGKPLDLLNAPLPTE